MRQMPKRYKNKEDLTSCGTKLTVPDAGLPGLEGVVLHPIPSVADDFRVFPVLAVSVLLLLGAAEVPLVTGQPDVGPQDPVGPRRHDCLVGESDLVVGGELVGLQSSSGSVKY